MKEASFFKNHYPYFVSILLIFLFVYASVSKIADHENFTLEVGKSPILTKFTYWVSWGIPAIELFISGLLAIKRFRLAGFYLSFSLLIMFTTYLLVILKFSFFIPCTCGGVLQSLNWNTHIVFNSFFIVLAGFAVVVAPK